MNPIKPKPSLLKNYSGGLSAPRDALSEVGLSQSL